MRSISSLFFTKGEIVLQAEAKMNKQCIRTCADKATDWIILNAHVKSRTLHSILHCKGSLGVLVLIFSTEASWQHLFLELLLLLKIHQHC